MFVALVALTATATAHAGACMPCTVDSECGTGGICVEWIGAPACSMAPRSCCPGQGCAVMGGVASCVPTGRCRIPTAGADAGTTDVVTGSDVAGADVNTGGDSGGTGDASGDTGTTTMRSGCGCRAGGTGRTGLAALALLAFAVIAARRRTTRA